MCAYNIYARVVQVSEIERVRFLILLNSWIKIVRAHFPWSNLYILFKIWSRNPKRVMQNDAELGFLVFVVEACLYQHIQWYAILLIKRKKKEPEHCFYKERPSNYQWKRNRSRRGFSRFKSYIDEREIQKVTGLSYNNNFVQRLTKNAICILFVTFCPKAFKHWHFI